MPMTNQKCPQMSIDLTGVLAGMTMPQFATLPQWKVVLMTMLSQLQQNRSFIDLLDSLVKTFYH